MERRERMAAADAAWLRAEAPGRPMTVVAALWFDRPLDWERLRAALQERLVERFPRFRQRVVERGLLEWPYWEDDPHFELEGHLHACRLPPPGGRQELAALVSRLLPTPLFLSRPPWRLHLVDGYGEGSAVVARLHHCLADGIALAQVLLSLTDAGAAARRAPRPAPVAARPRARPAREGGPAPLDAARGLLSLLPPDPPSPLRGPGGGPQRAVWSAPLPLGPLRRAGRPWHASVHEVALAALAGALRGHLERHAPSPSAPLRDLRALVPVHLRPHRSLAAADLGNDFGLALLPLPVGEPHPHERLRQVQQRMAALRRSPQVGATRGLMRLFSAAPQRVEHRLLTLFASRASLVTTSVPGPRHPVSLGGVPLAGLAFWVPRPSPLGLSVSLFTYAGHLTLGVASDTALLPRPEGLLEALEAELAQLPGA